MHVEGGRLLVEPDELDAGRPVLEQIDAALVVVDRGAALALVPEGGSDLAMQIRDAGEVLLGAVVVEAALPDRDRRVHTSHSQRHVALFLAHARDRARIQRLGDLERGRVAVEGLRVRVEGGRSIARGLEGLEGPGLQFGEGVTFESRLRAEGGGAREVLGDQADDTVASLTGALANELGDLDVLPAAH